MSLSRPFYEDPSVRLFVGDALGVLADLPQGSVQACVTSPPYWGLRDYGVEGQTGLEATPEAYVDRMVAVFREVRRVLRDDGTLWLNLGDAYCSGTSAPRKPGRGDVASWTNRSQPERIPAVSGLKPKDLVGISWMVAFALRQDGWWLRSDIIWHKPNPMPESVVDRPTRSHEYIFLLTKSARYFYDHEAIREPATYSVKERPGRALLDHKSAPTVERNGIRPRETDKQRGHGRVHAGFNDRWDGMTKEEQGALGRNKRDVWTVATQPYPEAHFATFPEGLIVPCILAGAPQGGVVLDPFAGSGTTLAVAKRLGRQGVGIELNEAYALLAAKRVQAETAALL